MCEFQQLQGYNAKYNVQWIHDKKIIKEETFSDDQKSKLNETELGNIKYGSKVGNFS